MRGQAMHMLASSPVVARGIPNGAAPHASRRRFASLLLGTEGRHPSHGSSGSNSSNRTDNSNAESGYVAGASPAGIPAPLWHQKGQLQQLTTVTVTNHEAPAKSSSSSSSSDSTAGASRAAPTAAVDLRSDTMTKPCKRLRAAMAGAEVGDDVFGEDPTVVRLEDCVAYLLGKEKGLLVPSGTMGNLIAVGAHCRRGDELILGDKSHIFQYEGAGASALMGVSYHTVRNAEDGGLEVADIQTAVRGDDPHYPRSSLLCLENTQNLCGARAIAASRMAEMCAAGRHAGLKVHVDGARLWNAAVSLEVRPSELVSDADSVSVCLSKGLGAPVGSVLVGSEQFIYEARRLRKSLGGGMRQSGVIAAAGLEAVVNNYVRLSEDHDNAAALASGLGALRGISAERSPGDTNAVYFQVTGMDAQAFVDALERDHGVLMGSGYFGGSTIRAMTHLDVNREGVERAIEASRAVLAEAPAS
ncbi:Threonine aldolase [Ectocarpus siliculosus]|uniref:Threonine aldolase n=1 Tax=Ectocarpus siliculosus TaxID=2880 RepID=D7FWM2_ECTSI|nr:Threonine aldolase [Ectocarpus siliculosus]|eukprot:CBJ32110.1 Threonine aldolase [Ectocarpus siliculosus]